MQGRLERGSTQRILEIMAVSPQSMKSEWMDCPQFLAPTLSENSYSQEIQGESFAARCGRRQARANRRGVSVGRARRDDHSTMAHRAVGRLRPSPERFHGRGVALAGPRARSSPSSWYSPRHRRERSRPRRRFPTIPRRQHALDRISFRRDPHDLAPGDS